MLTNFRGTVKQEMVTFHFSWSCLQVLTEGSPGSCKSGLSNLNMQFLGRPPKEDLSRGHDVTFGKEALAVWDEGRRDKEDR